MAKAQSYGDARKSRRYTCQDPLIVPPLAEHRRTWIILHGRGSNAPKFGTELLATQIPGHESLHSAFPCAKFVFPTASASRATIYKRSIIHQWFDNWSLTHPEDKEELQSEGLRKTTLYLHGLLREEIAIIGAKNVIFGGLSQGCAASLIAMLLWDGEPLGAVFGLCGWLPYCRHLYERALDAQDHHPSMTTDDKDDFFECEVADAKNSQRTSAERAIEYLVEELALRGDVTASSDSTPVPIFLGHGVNDDRVPLGVAIEAAACLETLGVNIGDKKRNGGVLRKYQDLGHWYSAKMLGDLVDFVNAISENIG